MATNSEDSQHWTTTPPNADDKEQAVDVTDDRIKTTTRHPRWTRQETFVLIEGKKVVESQVQRTHRSTSNHVESKWDLVASYCRQNGVKRAPVQCKKRWSNLLCDFKKINIWEDEKDNGADSFWTMRKELRRERKLPSFFDREVYDVLGGRDVVTDAIPLSVVMTATTDMNYGDGEAVEDEKEGDDEEEEAEAEKVSESVPHDATEDGSFSSFEWSGQDRNAWISMKEAVATKDPGKGLAIPLLIPGTIKRKSSESTSQEGWKRRQVKSDGCNDTNLQDQLVKILEKNVNMMNIQLETWNKKAEMDSNQRREYNDSLVAVLNKLADALLKIADKL